MSDELYIFQGVQDILEKLSTEDAGVIADALAEHGQLEQEQKMSGEMFKIVTESAADAIFVTDQKGNYVYVNLAASNLLGYSFDELTNMNIADISLDAETEKNVQNFEKLLKDGKLSYELFLIRKDGSIFYSDLNAVTLPNGLVYGSCRDITTSKQLEKRFSESEKNSRAWLEHSPVCTKIVDLDFNLQYMSTAGIDGLNIDDITTFYGKPYPFDFYPESFRSLMIGNLERVKETGEIIEQEGSVVDVDGSELWFHSTLVPINGEDDQIDYIIVVSVDITERKQAEELLATEKERLTVTLRSIGDGVITTDIHGRIVFVNRVAEQLTGWTQSEAQGEPLPKVLRIINEITRRPCKNPVEKVLATGLSIELANHTVLLSRDGSERVISDSGAPIKNKNGVTVGVVLVFRDMTEKMKIQDVLQRTAKLNSLGILAGGIAHDFNNLLGSIYGNIDLANDSSSDPKVSNYLEKTLDSLDRARDLTGQLLTFAKGGDPVQKIGPLFPFVKECALFALSGSNISCRFDVPPDLWLCNFDKNQIGQVIDNLVINAQQAMPLGGTIELSARNTELKDKGPGEIEDGRYVKISIRDYGVGVPKEMVAHIFDPFFTTKTKGHGLGLATCHSIINRHGGRVDVESYQGQGSTFHVYLPATDYPASSSQTKATGKHHGKGTILVMDDEEAVRDVIGNILESLGYTAVCKDNGRDTIEFFAEANVEKHRIEAMFLDLTIPGGMGGKEVIVEVRKLNREIPVFVLSGYAVDPIMANPAEYGFTASMCKPFRKTELVRLLSKHLR